MPLYTKYEGIRYDDPMIQAEFQKLVEGVAAAERARSPLQEQQRRAEADRDAGNISDAQFRAADDKYISANNTIAAAMKKVDEFLQRNKDYRVVKA